MKPAGRRRMGRQRKSGQGWRTRPLSLLCAFALAVVGLPMSGLSAVAAPSNVARTASVSVSSQNTATGQQGVKAVDGVADGYPGDATKEWATIGGKAGAFIKLTWSAPVTIDRVVLRDRPNPNDRVTRGQLTFSAGTAVSVGSLTNNGTGVTVNFPARTVTSLTFTVSAVATTTYNVGLSELEVWGETGAPTNQRPVAQAGPDQGVVVDTVVTLDGTGSSDPDGNPLSYRWTPPSGVSLSSTTAAKPTFTASTAGTFTFSLVVNDGTLDSSADTVVITVTRPSTAVSNVARLATATASSQNTSTGQTAAKAIDGVVGGHPGDHTKEWATVGGRAGSTLTLTWPTAVTIDKIVLYDRPNLDDRVTSGQLTFVGANPLNVSTLNNNGSATTINLTTPRTVTSLTLTVLSVSTATHNVGLSEIEVWGTQGVPANRQPVANAGPDQTVRANAVVTLDGSASSDPDGDPLTYQWTAAPGVTLSSTTAAKPTFTAATGGPYTFTLVVSDGELASTSDAMVVTVAANLPPVANAGPDQSVAAGAVVTLNGSGSDSDGQALTYQWTAPVGVTLSDPTAAQTTFTAGTTPGTQHTFTLTVSDGQLSATDDVVVTVGALGVLTVAASGGSAVWTANFDGTIAGRTIRLEKQTIATTIDTDLVNYVATPTWVQVQTATANSSGDATFTVTNPLEVQHNYRAVANPGGSQQLSNEVAYEAPRTTKSTGLATVYIDTNESEAITSKEDYWEGKFTMDAPNGSRCTGVAPMTMKVSGRGNSTWDLPKKPYKFSLATSTDLCGMGAAKKWNLIANYEDDSLIRNSLVMKMGSMLTNLEWTPKSTPVDVYVNGTYQGSYTIMDRVTIAKTRINIPSMKAADNTAPNITGGYLLEWDNRRTSDHNVCVGGSAVVTSGGTASCGGSGWVGIKEPEDEADGTGITPEQIAYIDGYLESADDAIAAGNWEDYVDAGSAADYLIAMELTKNYGANFRSSVFMYKKRDADLVTPGDQGKLYFGPLWDFDTSFGNATYGGPSEATTSGWWVSEPDASISAVQGVPTWFHHMMDDPAFRQVVTNRWNQLKANGFKAQSDGFIASEKAFIAKSAAADKALWNGSDAAAGASTLQSWFTNRWNWLDGQW